MYGITFELDKSDLQMFYSQGASEAYAEIAQILQPFGFTGVGNTYVCKQGNLANMMAAVEALKKQSWFSSSVRNMETFRVAEWVDLTDFVRA